jgi:peptidoglycan hydrolase CwlO-like protein
MRKKMKKLILLIPVLALMFACSGKTGQPAETLNATQEQTEAVEQSTRELDEVVNSSEAEIDTIQSEIDDLLDEI